MTYISYESAVHLIRSQSGGNDWAKDCYLEEDVLCSAQRFSHSEEFQAVISILGLNNDKNLKILDLGCGNGIASFAIANLGHAVVAVDPDESSSVGLGAVESLSPFLQYGSIQTIKSFAESLPLEDNQFDIVYSRQALHHFQDLEQSMSECFRVLRKGGMLFATREHIAENQKELDIFLSNHILHQLHGGENAYPEAYYIHSMRQAGFSLLRVFRSYDTVINYYPLSQKKLNQLFLRFLEKKIGSHLALKVSSINFLMQLYQKYLSAKLLTPGRPYSFLCRK